MPPSVLTSRARDFPRWYQDVVAKAELAENGPVRGSMVIRPYGYALWERMQAALDERIKAAGAENVALPLLIPEGYLRREAEHIEGFSPELAVVTHAGGKQLEEPAVIRPTSETLFGEAMARWVQSYRDLPLLLNQWGNAVRWELRPRIFLRTTEFLWQEGHTAHATQVEAAAYARRILRDVYRDFFVNVLAMPVLVGAKSVRERFAGAINTLSCEAMMGDGKALQSATSHELGQNFARAFDISYSDAAGGRQHAWTTSWGSSTRMVGGLIMAHGDDDGLRLPPRIAPVQVVVIVVRDHDGAAAAGGALVTALTAAGVRARLDDRVDASFGRRVTDWEIKGVPIRIELGPRDLAIGQVVVAQRGADEKDSIGLPAVVDRIRAMLDALQETMLAEATAARDARTVTVRTVPEAQEVGQRGFARLPLAALGVNGEEVLAQGALTVRCIQRADGSVPDSDAEPDLFAIVARSY